MNFGRDFIAMAEERDRLRQELSLAQEGLANYQQDHQQYVEWASPQLERLGREMQENERLREFISAFQELLDLDPENHPGTDLGRLMLEITEYLRHQPQSGPT